MRELLEAQAILGSVDPDDANSDPPAVGIHTVVFGTLKLPL